MNVSQLHYTQFQSQPAWKQSDKGHMTSEISSFSPAEQAVALEGETLERSGVTVIRKGVAETDAEWKRRRANALHQAGLRAQLPLLPFLLSAFIFFLTFTCLLLFLLLRTISAWFVQLLTLNLIGQTNSVKPQRDLSPSLQSLLRQGQAEGSSHGHFTAFCFLHPF